MIRKQLSSVCKCKMIINRIDMKKLCLLSFFVTLFSTIAFPILGKIIIGPTYAIAGNNVNYSLNDNQIFVSPCWEETNVTSSQSGLTDYVKVYLHSQGDQAGDFDKRITWKVKKAINLDNPADQFEFNCQFITHGNNPIKWIQSGEAGASEFTITSVESQWIDVSKSGTVKFHVTQDGTNGSLTIKRKAGKTVLIMEMGKGGRYKFEISDYQKEQ